MNKKYPCPYCSSMPMYGNYKMFQCPFGVYPQMYNQGYAEPYMPYADEMEDADLINLRDYGPRPFVVNIEEATKQNDAFRLALWTGKHLQLTLMSIEVGGDIGLEMHSDLDQFIRIEEGQGIVKMGNRKDNLSFQANVQDDFIFIIPAGTWHNLINTGNKPIKLYSIYAPPQHPYGTIHETQADAIAAEEEHDH